MILKHYFVRSIKDPLNFLMLILFPLVMITIFITTSRQDIPFILRSLNGYCLVATNQTFFNVLFFQYFCGMLVSDYLYRDFRSDMRWRLMASPQPFSRFVISAIVSSIFVSMINGTLVLTAARFIFDAYFNIPMMIAVLLGMSVFVTLFGVLLFMICQKKGTSTAVIMVFAFAQMLMINFGMITFPPPGEIGIANFLPIVAGTRALEYASGMRVELHPELSWLGGFTELGTDMPMAFANLGILAALVALALVAVIIVGRKRKI